MSEDKIKPRIIKEDDSDEKTEKEKSNRELRREKAMLKAKIKSRAKLIFYTLLIVGVVVAAVIFSIFTFFKVNKVNIQGSNIYTSEEIMDFDNSAPAPPTAAKYTARLRTIASFTSFDRFPLPIIPPNPRSKSAGAYLSIRLDVVGPAEPIALPSLAGEGPI